MGPQGENVKEEPEGEWSRGGEEGKRAAQEWRLTKNTSSGKLEAENARCSEHQGW